MGSTSVALEILEPELLALKDKQLSEEEFVSTVFHLVLAVFLEEDEATDHGTILTLLVPKCLTEEQEKKVLGLFNLVDSMQPYLRKQLIFVRKITGNDHVSFVNQAAAVVQCASYAIDPHAQQPRPHLQRFILTGLVPELISRQEADETVMLPPHSSLQTYFRKFRILFYIWKKSEERDIYFMKAAAGVSTTIPLMVEEEKFYETLGQLFTHWRKWEERVFFLRQAAMSVEIIASLSKGDMNNSVKLLSVLVSRGILKKEEANALHSYFSSSQPASKGDESMDAHPLPDAMASQEMWLHIIRTLVSNVMKQWRDGVYASEKDRNVTLACIMYECSNHLQGACKNDPSLILNMLGDEYLAKEEATVVKKYLRDTNFSHMYRDKTIVGLRNRVGYLKKTKQNNRHFLSEAKAAIRFVASLLDGREYENSDLSFLADELVPEILTQKEFDGVVAQDLLTNFQANKQEEPEEAHEEDEDEDIFEAIRSGRGIETQRAECFVDLPKSAKMLIIDFCGLEEISILLDVNKEWKTLVQENVTSVTLAPTADMNKYLLLATESLPNLQRARIGQDFDVKECGGQEESVLNFSLLERFFQRVRSLQFLDIHFTADNVPGNAPLSSLCRHTELKVLRLDCVLGHVSELCNLLRPLNKLACLDLRVSFKRSGHDDLLELAGVINDKKKLQSLMLLVIPMLSPSHLRRLLEGSGYLRHLGLCSSHVDLADDFAWCSSHVNLTDETCDIIASECPNLRVLGLDNKHISTEAIVGLVRRLPLRHLELKEPLEYRGIAAMGDRLWRPLVVCWPLPPGQEMLDDIERDSLLEATRACKGNVLFLFSASNDTVCRLEEPSKLESLEDWQVKQERIYADVLSESKRFAAASESLRWLNMWDY